MAMTPRHKARAVWPREVAQKKYSGTGRHSGRKPPTAAALKPSEYTQNTLRYGRTVYLYTSRGGVALTPAEARKLAAELVQAANTTQE